VVIFIRVDGERKMLQDSGHYFSVSLSGKNNVLNVMKS